jgi:site-specific recombinase XerC
LIRIKGRGNIFEKKKGLSVATIKNRNAHLRWACEVLGKMDVVPSNDALGIGKHCNSGNNINEGVDLDKIELSRITNRNVLVQIHLQRYLGLRREESIKFKPWQADKGDRVILQPSWCKGRRGREIPITTPEARYWLEEAKKLVEDKNQSLITVGKNYIQHRHFYDNQIHRAGIKHPHGLRHAYAQDRYKVLTGGECPKRDGPTHKQLTAEQKEIDGMHGQY